MIARLNGLLIEKSPPLIVLDCGGVGYEVEVPMSTFYNLPEVGAKVQLLTSFDPESAGVVDVPDPYYSDAALFDSVLTIIERASIALFRQLEPAIRQGVS